MITLVSVGSVDEQAGLSCSWKEASREDSIHLAVLCGLQSLGICIVIVITL